MSIRVCAHKKGAPFYWGQAREIVASLYNRLALNILVCIDMLPNHPPPYPRSSAVPKATVFITIKINKFIQKKTTQGGGGGARKKYPPPKKRKQRSTPKPTVYTPHPRKTASSGKPTKLHNVSSTTPLSQPVVTPVLKHKCPVRSHSISNDTQQQKKKKQRGRCSVVQGKEGRTRDKRREGVGHAAVKLSSPVRRFPLWRQWVGGGRLVLVGVRGVRG